MQAFMLEPAGLRQFTWLLVLTVVLPALVAWGALLLAGGGVRAAFVLPVGALFALVALVLGAAMSRQQAIVDGDALRLTSSFYSTAIPLSRLAPGARVVASGDEAAALGLRTNGVALPGYRSGWFRGKSGRKVFAAIVGEPNLFIPTQDGPDLLLTVPDPQAALDALRARTKT